jgi:hypothetical protein
MFKVVTCGNQTFVCVDITYATIIGTITPNFNMLLFIGDMCLIRIRLKYLYNCKRN